MMKYIHFIASRVDECEGTSMSRERRRVGYFRVRNERSEWRMRNGNSLYRSYQIVVISAETLINIPSSFYNSLQYNHHHILIRLYGRSARPRSCLHSL